MAQTGSGTMNITYPSDLEILITRTINAPRHLVYRAWTTPALVKRWWSGRRGQMTVAQMDFRVGGSWRYVMVADGGFEVAFHGTYREIVAAERIVSTEIFEMPGEEPMADQDAPVNTVTFQDADGGATTICILTNAGSKEVRDAIAQSGMEAGVREQFELIEELAASLG